MGNRKRVAVHCAPLSIAGLTLRRQAWQKGRTEVWGESPREESPREEHIYGEACKSSQNTRCTLTACVTSEHTSHRVRRQTTPRPSLQADAWIGSTHVGVGRKPAFLGIRKVLEVKGCE